MGGGDILCILQASDLKIQKTIFCTEYGKDLIGYIVCLKKMAQGLKFSVILHFSSE